MSKIKTETQKTQQTTTTTTPKLGVKVVGKINLTEEKPRWKDLLERKNIMAEAKTLRSPYRIQLRISPLEKQFSWGNRLLLPHELPTHEEFNKHVENSLQKGCYLFSPRLKKSFYFKNGSFFENHNSKKELPGIEHTW